MSEAFDVCVIGSGAGGGPVAMVLAEAGYRVVVLEKGPWYTERDFWKDEIAAARRTMFVPDRRDEPHVWEADVEGSRQAWVTRDAWNANCVGGATVVMSGYFLRLKPIDLRQHSELGTVGGASVEDWPIGYDDLAPFYDRVEREIGVSGRHVDHPWADRRTGDFPYPPLPEHPFAGLVDATCRARGLHPFPVPRAVLPQGAGERSSCNASGWCAGYGCTTGAKGSSLAALLPRAIATGRTEIRPRARVTRIVSDDAGRAVEARYLDRDGVERRVEARLFVVACSAIETARLLLLSPGARHPRGLANGNDLVGRHVLFSTFGSAWGDFPYARAGGDGERFRSEEPWVNRALQDWYVIDDPRLGRRKGGTLSFLLLHPNPIAGALTEALLDGRTLWGRPLKERLARHFKASAHLRVEVFGEYTPSAEGRVVLDPALKDRWGLPAARVRVVRHPRDRETATFLVDRGREILALAGAEQIRGIEAGGESKNLMGGTCRFGTDPARSVLDPDCRAWECDNLYVTDGSFLPTGGSVPFTFTIYANAFRVAERIVARLGGGRAPGAGPAAGPGAAGGDGED